MKKKATSKNVRVMEVGAGILTAAALAAAGAYLLSSKTQRAKAKAWMDKARKEVAQQVKRAKDMGEKDYTRIVDQAVKHYGTLHKVGVKEIVEVAKDMKSDWSRLRTNAEKMAKMVQKPKAKKQPARKAKRAHR